MRTRWIIAPVTVAAAVALTACGSSQPASSAPQGGVPATAAAAVSGASATPMARAGATTGAAIAAESGHYHAELALIGRPEAVNGGTAIKVTVRVTNDGPKTFGSATQPHSVNIGAHTIDASGKIVDLNLARGTLSQIAPGAAAMASILLPAKQSIGYRVQILPVEEGVAWFNEWGTSPLVIGPIRSCGDAGTVALCDAAGKLPIGSGAQ